MSTYVPLRTTGSSKDWDTTGLSQQQTNKNHDQEKEHSDVFTDSMHCGIVRRLQNVFYLDIDVYVRPSPYNMVFEEEGLGHNGTVTATRGKNTRRRSTSMSSQTAYTVALSGGHKKNNYLDIDVYVRPSPYNRLFEGLYHNGTVTATRGETQQGEEHSKVSQTTYTVASSGRQKTELLRYRCLRTSSFVQRALRRTGTQRDCHTIKQTKTTTRRRSTAMFSQTAYTVASSGGQKKNYLDIDVYVRPLRTTGYS